MISGLGAVASSFAAVVLVGAWAGLGAGLGAGARVMAIATGGASEIGAEDEESPSNKPELTGMSTHFPAPMCGSALPKRLETAISIIAAPVVRLAKRLFPSAPLSSRWRAPPCTRLSEKLPSILSPCLPRSAKLPSLPSLPTPYGCSRIQLSRAVSFANHTSDVPESAKNTTAPDSNSSVPLVAIGSGLVTDLLGATVFEAVTVVTAEISSETGASVARVSTMLPRGDTPLASVRAAAMIAATSSIDAV
mmetsp:Transcript_19990/g.50947  ORF Transcript_19990/g.50947 Transcript_19990/m.50947 type:complete len:249 (+) Transcript_19990:219-965(+)